ncbi:equilibrative nucleobase transporter 1-like [Hemitrygon akajei]|uniref:equilibrative nucleobase transporter 1-like n=1 Tax=Hemitrygon akajei TaxID=2704970 RepID=UPI003BFA210C
MADIRKSYKLLEIARLRFSTEALLMSAQDQALSRRAKEDNVAGNCTVRFTSNHIIMFADDTTMSLYHTVDCALQDEQFTLIYTIATFVMNIGGDSHWLLGSITVGTMVTRFVAIENFTTRKQSDFSLSLSLATSAKLLFPALTLLGLGGAILLISNVQVFIRYTTSPQVGNLFGSKRSIVITLYDGAYNSSPAVFLVVKVLYETGFSLRSIFLFISSLSLFHIVRTIFLMPRTHIPYPIPEGYTYGRSIRGAPTGKQPELGARAWSRPEEELKREGTTRWLGGRDGRMESKGDTAEIHESSDGNLQPNGKEESVDRDNQDQIPSFANCIFSRLYLTHLLWLSLIQLRHFLFIGTLNPMLNLMTDGDPNKVSSYTNAFAFTQMCAVFCAPWNGLILDRHKRRSRRIGSRLEDMQSAVLSLVFIVTLSVLFSLCAAIPVLKVQFLTFILHVVHVAFLYGSEAAFVAVAFPPCCFGKVYGTTQALAAMFSLIQYPCFILVKGPLKNNPLYLNVVFIALVSLAFAHPLNVYLWCRRKRMKRTG